MRYLQHLDWICEAFLIGSLCYLFPARHEYLRWTLIVLGAVMVYLSIERARLDNKHLQLIIDASWEETNMADAVATYDRLCSLQEKIDRKSNQVRILKAFLFIFELIFILLNY
jgi:hypothetical protein